MDSQSLVPGDIVMIRDGERVPADIRIIEVQSPCRFDTSAITGDLTPRNCAMKDSSPDYLQSQNMAFCGYLCIQGFSLDFSTINPSIFSAFSSPVAIPTFFYMHLNM